jgi:hypothetical protein
MPGPTGATMPTQATPQGALRAPAYDLPRLRLRLWRGKTTKPSAGYTIDSCSLIPLHSVLLVIDSP